RPRRERGAGLRERGAPEGARPGDRGDRGGAGLQGVADRGADRRGAALPRDRMRTAGGDGRAVQPARRRDHVAGAALGADRDRAAGHRRGAAAPPRCAARQGARTVRRLVFGLLVALAGLAALVWAGEIGWGPFVITREGEQKIVLLLGSPVSVQTQPGISLRLPFASTVLTFDRRFLHFNSLPQQIQTGDAERPVIDHYVVWRIADPLKFFASFPSGVSQAEAQIDRVTRSDLREVIGQKTLAQLVTSDRERVMKEIT